MWFCMIHIWIMKNQTGMWWNSGEMCFADKKKHFVQKHFQIIHNITSPALVAYSLIWVMLPWYKIMLECSPSMWWKRLTNKYVRSNINTNSICNAIFRFALIWIHRGTPSAMYMRSPFFPSVLHDSCRNIVGNENTTMLVSMSWNIGLISKAWSFQRLYIFSPRYEFQWLLPAAILLSHCFSTHKYTLTGDFSW